MAVTSKILLITLIVKVVVDGETYLVKTKDNIKDADKIISSQDGKNVGPSGKHADYSNDYGRKFTKCKKRFICTKDNTCAMDGGQCLCHDEAASMPVCANPDCGDYCGGGSRCKNTDGIWGCQCLPSFNYVGHNCVKKQECKKPDAIVGAVGFAVDNTNSMCDSLDGAKELARSLTKELEGKNVPNWILVTFTVVRPQTNDIKRNTKLVIDTPDVKEFISSVSGISCSGGSPDGTTRAMQGIKRIFEVMPKGGTVVVITDNRSFDLNLTPKLLKIQLENELNVLIALAPKYRGERGDETWKRYVTLSNSHIFQMDKFDKKSFMSAAVTEVENTCGNDEIIQRGVANEAKSKGRSGRSGSGWGSGSGSGSRCSTPCTGGAMCKKRKFHNGWKCKCQKGLKYSKGKCVPKCKPSCKGGSTCLFVDSKPKCVCRRGLSYIGRKCTVKCNPGCKGGSTCRLVDGKPTCVCVLGSSYIGGQCVSNH